MRSLRRVEIHQAREFGKLAQKLRYNGCLPREGQVAVTRGLRLFNKNVAYCEGESPCTVSEFCPVAVRESSVQRAEAPLNGGGNYNPLKVA